MSKSRLSQFGSEAKQIKKLLKLGLLYSNKESVVSRSQFQYITSQIIDIYGDSTHSESPDCLLFETSKRLICSISDIDGEIEIEHEILSLIKDPEGKYIEFGRIRKELIRDKLKQLLISIEDLVPKETDGNVYYLSVIKNEPSIRRNRKRVITCIVFNENLFKTFQQEL